MEYILSILIGYFIGSINPSYLISRHRGMDIKSNGSGNAGASNALILFGKTVGVVCAMFDIAKAGFAVWLCHNLFSENEHAFIIAGVSAILGHVFPMYTKF